ncbi:MAG: ribbon-helix-helix protein, CopG family [Ilumatobacteraceae bacterium]
MNQKYPTITIRVDKKLKTLIERQAKKQDVTVSELLRKFIETGLHNV